MLLHLSCVGETLEERIEVSQAKKNAIIAGDNRLENRPVKSGHSR